jgi:hypothetical protein
MNTQNSFLRDFNSPRLPLPVTQGRVCWIGATQWERMAAKPTTPPGYPIKVASGGRAYSINRSGPHVYGQRHLCR